MPSDPTDLDALDYINRLANAAGRNVHELLAEIATTAEAALRARLAPTPVDRNEAERLLTDLEHAMRDYANSQHAKYLKARAAVLTAMTRKAPPGFKLVPVEPTRAMLRAAWDDGAVGGEREHRDIYTAMLAAAPEAP